MAPSPTNFKNNTLMNNASPKSVRTQQANNAFTLRQAAVSGDKQHPNSGQSESIFKRKSRLRATLEDLLYRKIVTKYIEPNPFYQLNSTATSFTSPLTSANLKKRQDMFSPRLVSQLPPIDAKSSQASNMPPMSPSH